LYRERYFDDLLENDMKTLIEKELKEKLKNDYDADNILISALNKENMGELRMTVLRMVKEQYEIRYPYQAKVW
jgi:GTP-binding protein HflX